MTELHCVYMDSENRAVVYLDKFRFACVWFSLKFEPESGKKLTNS